MKYLTANSSKHIVQVQPYKHYKHMLRITLLSRFVQNNSTKLDFVKMLKVYSLLQLANKKVYVISS